MDQGEPPTCESVWRNIQSVFFLSGNNAIREAMHSVFLYHAIQAGLDMGIVNAGQLAVYSEIPDDVRERVEDVILNRRPDAADRLLEIADTVESQGGGSGPNNAWRELAIRERLTHALSMVMMNLSLKMSKRCDCSPKSPFT